jgi:hypothetical protein
MPRSAVSRSALTGAVVVVVAFQLTTARGESPGLPTDLPWALLFNGPIDLSTPWPDRGLSSAASQAADPGPPARKDWHARIEIEKHQPAVPWRSEPAAAGTSRPQADGAARASVTAPGFDSALSWDEVSIESRVDPLQQQGQFATTLRRSLAVTGNFALTLEGGYSMTQSLSSLPASTNATPERPVWGGERRVRLSILPSDTTITLGSTTITAIDQQWLHSLSAEQKLLGGPLRLIGAVSETTTGEINKTFKAGFTRAW